MFTKIITFNDVANNYSAMKYGSYQRNKTILWVRSKFGNYTRIWDKNDNIIKTTFVSKDGFILEDDE